MSGAGRIEVLSPVAERFHRPPRRPVAPRLAGLGGARIGIVDNGFAAGRILHEVIREALAADVAGVVTVERRYWRALDADAVGQLAERVDAVVGGLCDTPPSTMAGVSDAARLEDLGRPTVILATAFYRELLDQEAANQGLPELRRILLPHPLEASGPERVRSVGLAAVRAVVAALTDPDGPVECRIDP